jgi:hypothetical protein
MDLTKEGEEKCFSLVLLNCKMINYSEKRVMLLIKLLLFPSNYMQQRILEILIAIQSRNSYSKVRTGKLLSINFLFIMG